MEPEIQVQSRGSVGRRCFYSIVVKSKGLNDKNDRGFSIDDYIGFTKTLKLKYSWDTKLRRGLMVSQSRKTLRGDQK